MDSMTVKNYHERPNETVTKGLICSSDNILNCTIGLLGINIVRLWSLCQSFIKYLNFVDMLLNI